MKKFFLAAVAALVVVGLVFVACKKEITNTDKVATEQVVKHQKAEGDTIFNIPNVLYSSDGITFFDENGTAVTGIHVEYGDLCGTAVLGTDENGNQHIISCESNENNCGNAIISYDGTSISQPAIYAIRDDGTIITQPLVYC
ncbi:MAG: hypothetical protein J5725_10955 [Bacteroidales bacterium]|nr:hypothetical protein [Bacteroidales bacterium]